MVGMVKMIQWVMRIGLNTKRKAGEISCFLYIYNKTFYRLTLKHIFGKILMEVIKNGR